MRRLLALLAALVLASPASAYWEFGHQTVARIAMANVRPHTARAVRRILADEKLLGTPECPARSPADAAVWADCIKPLKDAAGQPRFGYAYAWHFQDVNICRPFDLVPACKDGNCVSAQIEREVALLRSNRTVPKHLPRRTSGPSPTLGTGPRLSPGRDDASLVLRPSLENRRTSRAERVQALAFLFHFVGDLHQPLHAGEKDDKGGNDVGASYGIYAPKRFNLHSVWDGPLAERAITTGPSLVRRYPVAERMRIAKGSVADWSRESWRVAHDIVYASALGGDPCAPNPTSVALSDATIARLVPAARRQVLRSGLRLAKLLDRSLS